MNFLTQQIKEINEKEIIKMYTIEANLKANSEARDE